MTTVDHLASGLLGLLLCMLAFIVWLFVVIMLGWVWRRVTKRPRERAIQAILVVLLVLTAALMVGVPHTAYEGEFDDPDNSFDYSQLDCYGVTSWYVMRTDWTPAPPTLPGWTLMTNTSMPKAEISIVGIIAQLPSLIVLFLLARWQWRNVPGFYRRPDSHCDWCDYDLRGHHSPVCPECGETVT